MATFGVANQKHFGDQEEEKRRKKLKKTWPGPRQTKMATENKL